MFVVLLKKKPKKNHDTKYSLATKKWKNEKKTRYIYFSRAIFL